MPKYKKKIALELIAAYNKGTASIPISRIEKKYDPVEYDVYETVNDAANELVKEGYITLQMESPRHSRIKRLKIVEERVEEFAEKYGAITRSNINSQCASLLNKYKDSQFAEITSFVSEQISVLQNGKAVKFVNGEDVSILEAVLAASEAILNQTEDIALRALSSVVFQDTKMLEKVLDGALSIINPNQEDKDSFLEKHHIFRNSIFVEFKGNGKIVWSDGSVFPLIGNHAIQMDIGWVEMIDRVETASVLTIENLTSFEQYIVTASDGLVVYLSGFTKDVIVEFLKKTRAQITHFGDMDANGFKIPHNLSERVGKEVNLWKMDEATALAHIDKGKPMSQFNFEQLTKMIDNDQYSENEKAVFKILLDNKKTIDQEIIELK